MKRSLTVACPRVLIGVVSLSSRLHIYSEYDVKLHRTGVFARLVCVAAVEIELAPLPGEHKAIHTYLLWHPKHRRLLLIHRC